LNLIRLLARLAELRLYDNTRDADPFTGSVPRPLLILHFRKGLAVEIMRVDAVPEWAKPIVMAAMKLGAV
jgi:hypothetical protein